MSSVINEQEITLFRGRKGYKSTTIDLEITQRTNRKRPLSKGYGYKRRSFFPPRVLGMRTRTQNARASANQFIARTSCVLFMKFQNKV